MFGVSLPYAKPVEWTTGGLERQAHYLIVRIWDREGRQAAAEAVCRPAWNGMSQAGLAQLFIDVAWPVLTNGGPPSQIRDLKALSVLVDNLLADFGHGPETEAGHSAAGPAIFVATRGTPAEMAREAASAIARGFGAVKLKLGQGLAVDEAVLAETRKAVGPRVVLCGDANGAYGGYKADAVLAMAQEYGLDFIEDPRVLMPLRSSFDPLPYVDIPIVVDRYCDSLLAARQYLELGHNRIAAKPARVGATEAAGMINAVAGSGGRAVIGLFGESSAGALAQLRLGAEVDEANLFGIEASFHEVLGETFLRFPLNVEDGRYAPPPTFHLAAAIDWEKLETLADTKHSLKV